MTMTAISTVDTMIEDKALRDAMIDRLNVLDKVKALFLIPGIEMATMMQVAEFYEVDPVTIRLCFNRNKEEIEADGIKALSGKGLLLLHDVTVVQKKKGCIEFRDDLDNTFEVSNAPTTFFSKRAILRIGMLLTKSPVAKEVRTQLLNIQEHASDKQKVFEIDREQMLLLRVIQADSPIERAEAMSVFLQHTKRYAQKVEEMEQLSAALQQENEVLTQENEAYSRDAMKWDDRAILDKLVKTYAAKAYDEMPYPKAVRVAWKRFYTELYYDHGISLWQRRKSHGDKGKYLDRVREGEWPRLVSKAFAMCRRIRCDVERCIENDVVYQQILEYSAMEFPANDLESDEKEDFHVRQDALVFQ